jgi:F-type H+-transporting ATPase subunit a
MNLFESIVEVMMSYVDQVTGDRKKSLKFLPIVGSFFLFILVANWMGLLPGTGSIAKCYDHHAGVYVAYQNCLSHPEEFHAYPILRPSNTDLNLTLGMAVLAVLASHLLGIVAIGFFKYANKFIKLGDIWTALKTFNPIKILTAFIEFFVGLIEISSEIAKMVSLSLRLYGNIFAGEVLLTVLAGLVAVFVPLPFMALELLVGLIQAVVFSMLTLVYLNLATLEHGHEEEQHSTH